MLCVGVFLCSHISLLCVHVVCKRSAPWICLLYVCVPQWLLMCCVCVFRGVYVQAHVPFNVCHCVPRTVCACMWVPLTLSGQRARGAVCRRKCAFQRFVHMARVRCAHASYTAERLVRPERPGVMSDARGGFLPTSPLACWLTNGLLSGLADRLAGSQWLRLPYLVVEGGGMVAAE